MHSCWKGISPHRVQTTENTIVELSGLNLDLFQSYPVEINFGKKDYMKDCEDNPGINLIDEKNVIWTYEIGSKDEGKPTLLMVHGFGACSMFFYQTWEKLSESFHIFCIDLLGFGRSSRPRFTCKTYEEAEDFFLLSIESWREQMKLDSFNILCHSFGGYIMGRYALRFSEHIQKVIFLSSLGVDYIPEDIDEGLNNFYKQLSYRKRAVFKIQKHMPKFIKTMAPFSPLRVIGRASKIFLKKGMKRRTGNLPKEEFEALYGHLYQVTLKPASAERAIHILFTRNFIPKYPLIECINSPDGFKAKGIETCFIYGGADWLDMNMNGPKVSEVLSTEGHNVHVIPDADHHVFFENSDDLVKIVVEELTPPVSVECL
ncbi:unnamed protein product [Moneuplotes crassus]|uniref:AB hydrolase-1 domain-containing protein n=1 Tax=Euplotes crassus TaxID=5936 RepID=A0AAD1UMJ5_EUPCR|nr:unnamed protein product [Moneuplotes crassus]